MEELPLSASRLQTRSGSLLPAPNRAGTVQGLSPASTPDRG